MKFWLRGGISVVALAVALLCVGVANADSIHMNYSSTGISGSMDLIGTAIGSGVYQVTSVSGFENGTAITGLVGGTGPNYFLLPDGSAFLYDNLINPTGNPALTSPGLLYSLVGSVFPENIYWGGSSYLLAQYIGGGNFPNDFILTPLSIQVYNVPEPSSLALFGAGLIALGSIVRRTKNKFARKSDE